MQTVALSQVDSQELERTFQQEIQWWQNELFWDYQPAVSLIKKFIASRSLSGWALKTDAGSLSGYSYYVINHPVAYIGNLYIRSERASPAGYAELLDKILHSLRSGQEIRRIESQIFAFNCDLVPLFEQHEFTALKRHFLSLPLDHLVEGKKSELQPEFQISQWENRFFFPAAEVIYNSYDGSPDYELCHDYQSSEGCIRFLRNLVQHPGCGIFSPRISYVALDCEERVCGVLLTSKISPDTGMIPQISVRSDCQGKGLGSFLLQTYFREARQSGLERITLSVSEANHRACQLYLRLGFRKTKDFHAFVRDLG
ncbi:MAG: GNAT family N-acetyltransferase [Acidobacteria bacterium]|nr:GNAT family N-acetyltransferase [Acidobacteriota bacterium]MCZ6879298.1 GNAT family N-acetyltransferase [Acidobacteriota bacterium]